MSSNRNFKGSGWKLVAITTRKHFDAAMTLLGIDPEDSDWSVVDDGYMKRIYRRFGRRMKPVVRR